MDYINYFMSRKAGRPKVPKHEAKSPGISIRLSLAERKVIDDAIKRSGLRQSVWLRNSLLSAATGDKSNT
jgi:hypothetical protein